MVLDKLGNSLKETLKKVARAVFVDEKLVNELIKDIQRALLASDVNVQLVFELSNKIKERALDEKKLENISQKEYLIKIVYEELVKFLGEERKEIKIEKKPFKILMVGLYGSGKCVHPDSDVVLSSGDILKAEELYGSYIKENNEEVIDGGKILDVSNENLFVPSFNPETFNIESKKVTHLWKLDGKELLEVFLDNGNDFSVKVTPEHPFFVLRKGKLEKIRADSLNEDDFIATPFNYEINNFDLINLYSSLKKINLNIYYDNAKTSLIQRYGLLKKACDSLNFVRNYSKFTNNVKNNFMPIELVEDIEKEYIYVRYYNSNKKIKFPIHLNEDLAEFLGYLIGDGYMYHDYVEISTENQEIIDRVSYLSNALFDINPSVKRDLRTKAMYKVNISSKTLVKIFETVFKLKPGKKGKNLRLPLQILESPNFVIKKLLRAYFDCDASPSFNREIELTSESQILIKQINLLLNRFDIISSISKKYVKNNFYWRLYIRAKYAEVYAEKIGFIINSKTKKVENYRTIGLRQGCGKQDIIPVGNNLKLLRDALGFSIGQIQEYVSSYGIYEEKGVISRGSLSKLYSFYWNEKFGYMLDILDMIEKNKNLKDKYKVPLLNSVISFYKSINLVTEENFNLFLTKEGQTFLQKSKNYNCKESLEFMKSLVNSDVCWLRVKDIKKQKAPEFVYDLTVEDNHSFIADGIVVHNTTSIAKLAKYYSKRGYKVATIGLDVHRPAAPEQLVQISKQVNVKCFIDKGEPIEIYEKYEKELRDYDIVIVDTAGRDALNDDLIKEIREINDKVKADERLLVLSADIGQAAEQQARKFHETCNITGILISKLDGTAKGGGALIASSVSGAPVKFIGVGEKIDDLEIFNPKGFVGRLLGMGDLEGLLEKVKDEIDLESAEDLGKRFLKGDYNFLDLYEQMQSMKKLGPLNKVIEMIPGLGSSIPKDMLDVQEGKLKKWKFIMQSMTKEELENPEVLSSTRIERIAKGSGVKTSEVRELLKQYRQSKKMVKMMKGKDPSRLLKKFKIPGMK